MVSRGYRLADIGTDHAYIPIFLVEEGRVPSAVAMDINRGPLDRARENIMESGQEDKIQIRISDGFSALEEGEADAAVLAGMGGGLTIRILREGADVVRTLKECILQPQSEIEKVRAFLLAEGFSFTDEDMVEEDGKYYPIIKVTPPCGVESGQSAPQNKGGEVWSATQLRYGKLLLGRKNPVLREYLEREIRLRAEIIKGLGDCDSERAVQRVRELRDEMTCAEKGMEYYAVQGNYTGNRSDISTGGRPGV